MSVANELLKPRIVDVQAENSFCSKVALEPLERGFGHTLGNALRRILLSSIPGAAITECQIEGVLHEYSVVEGMHEDVIKSIINSGVPKIVYVSCNPATQARDMHILSKKYQVDRVRPVDMFPQTHHIESVALLTLRK